MDDAVRMHIESLRKLKTGELRTRYRDVFGEPAASFNRAYLFRRLAWRLQAEAEGDLSERARRRASELAKDSDLRGRAPQSYASLSAIAHRVTGTRWNGFQFFGLKQEWEA